MNKHSLFISDLHLSPQRPDLIQAFFYFLQHHAPKAENLFILGDLFEYWIGDDAAKTVGAEPILAAMKKISQICHCYFIAGNRDFLIDAGFEQDTGFTVLSDETVIDLYGQKTLLLHGDSLCTDDVAHMEFRQAMMTNAQWKNIFLSLPIEQRIQQAKLAREHSNMHKSQVSNAIMDVNENTVLEKFLQHDVKQMIQGHTHRQNTHHYDNGLTRFVLGDWDSTSSVLIAQDNGNISIQNAPIKA